MNDEVTGDLVIDFKSDIGVPFKINIFNVIEVIDIKIKLVFHGDVFHQIGMNKT